MEHSFGHGLIHLHVGKGLFVCVGPIDEAHREERDDAQGAEEDEEPVPMLFEELHGLFYYALRRLRCL